jgi:hypothetical protein
MEDNHDIVKGLVQLVIIALMTIFFFSLYSKKYIKLYKLLPLVLVSVWLVISVFLGIEYLVFRETNMFLSISNLVSLLKEALPMSIIFGGLMFAFKYRQLIKN